MEAQKDPAGAVALENIRASAHRTDIDSCRIVGIPAVSTAAAGVCLSKSLPPCAHSYLGNPNNHICNSHRQEASSAQEVSSCPRAGPLLGAHLHQSSWLGCRSP